MNTSFGKHAAWAGLVLLAGILSTSAEAQNIDVRTIYVGRDIMTTVDGRTLYTYDGDFYNISTCLGDCSTIFQPFLVASDSFPGGDFSIVGRPDGRRMWAHVGMPLYFYSKDSRRFDTRGDGVDGMWHVAILPDDN